MIEIDGSSLNITDLCKVAIEGETVKLSNSGREKLERATSWLDAIYHSGKAVYGINTGFGVFADRRIDDRDAALLSRNLIISHSVGIGEPLELNISRAAMLVRANALTAGYSGIRTELVENILEMLNQNLIPLIPSKGSLGSSGDLCLLSELALVLTTDDADREEESGKVAYKGQVMSGKAAMQSAGIPRLKLGPKEGLALTNGATFGAALAALVLEESYYLLDVAIASSALMIEAILGCSNAFDDNIQRVRNHPGQQTVANIIRAYLNHSKFVDSTNKIQDAYSIRCTPQILGPILETLDFVHNQVEREINAATDNPLIFNEEVSLSGGNFHGEIIGMGMDYVGIALAELGALSERRVFRLLDSNLNTGLPPMLVRNREAAGLNSGLMMPHYTATSLALENQTLAHPDSVHSLPTSAAQEDVNANSWTAAIHAYEILDNVRSILAIELFSTIRAIHIRFEQQPGIVLGSGTVKVYEQLKEFVPLHTHDDYWKPNMEKIIGLLKNRELKLPELIRGSNNES